MRVIRRRRLRIAGLCLVLGMTAPACLFTGLLLVQRAMQQPYPAQTGATDKE